MRNSLSLILIFLAALFAVPASPAAILLTQPDGSKFTAYNRGDEFSGWLETEDGYSIAKNNNGVWVFVRAFDGRRSDLTDYPAHFSFRPAVAQHLQPEPWAPEAELITPNISDLRTEFEVPFLLIDYPDMQGTYSQEDFDALLNSDNFVGPHGATGSFREFYQTQSYGDFNPMSTLFGWYTTDLGHDEYGYNAPEGWDMARQMIRQAVDDAEIAGVDWTQFDNDGDGFVDALNVIHAGFGAEEGNYSNVWSHRWALGPYAVEYDGVVINDYTINPEKQGQTNNNLVNIGVIAHEFGHALGLPDLYDTDYTSSGIGYWGLMSGGSWGGNGNSAWYPSHMSAWCKTEVGWIEPILIEEPSVILEIPNVEENPVCYKMLGNGAGTEYFLFTNRQQLLFDQTLVGHGLLIWHVDSALNNNQDEDHRLVDVEQADGRFDLNENYNSGDGNDPYPGNMGVTQFTDFTTPNSRFYGDLPSEISVIDISENDGVITANFRNIPTIFVENLAVEELNGDGDGLANPGELFSSIATFANPSGDLISDLSATISCNNPEVNILTPVVSIGDLQGFSELASEAFQIETTSEIDLGWHTIDITVNGMLGEDAFQQDVPSAFYIGLEQAGFPTELEDKVLSSPLLMDLNADGKREIIFGDYDGILHVKQSDGSDFPGDWPFVALNSNDEATQIWASVAAGDIDEDNEIELILAVKGKRCYILSSDGTVETIYETGQFLVGTPVIANMDDDSELEIVFAGYNSSGKVFAINPDGSDVSGFPVQLNEKFFESAAAADVNANGKADIVLGSDAENFWLILDDGTVADGFPVQLGDKLRSAPSIVSGNGFHHFCTGADNGMLSLISSTGNILWQYDAGASIRSSPVAKMYGFDTPTFFFSDDDGGFHILDYLGQSFPGYPMQFGQKTTPPVFSDLNVEGQIMCDIIVGDATGRLHAFHIDQSYIPRFPMQLGIRIDASAAIQDVDNDGDLEVFIGTERVMSGLDPKGPGELGCWNMYRGNPHRNGHLQVDFSFLPGDINLDNVVDILDITTIINTIFDSETPSELMLTQADLNDDGTLDILDIIAIIHIILED